MCCNPGAAMRCSTRGYLQRASRWSTVFGATAEKWSQTGATSGAPRSARAPGTPLSGCPAERTRSVDRDAGVGGAAAQTDARRARLAAQSPGRIARVPHPCGQGIVAGRNILAPGAGDVRQRDRAGALMEYRRQRGDRDDGAVGGENELTTVVFARGDDRGFHAQRL